MHALELFRLRPVRVGLFLHVTLALSLAFVPLFDVLGFERAFATGILAAITSPIVGASAQRHRRGNFLGVAANALSASLLCLLPSVVVGAAVEHARAPCNTEQGLLFMLLVAGGNAAFGTALGLVAAAVSPRRAVTAALVTNTLLVSLGASLLRFYTDPQIFAYSVPWGFWPGSLYDETLEVTGTLWAFRAFTLFVTLAMVLAAAAFEEQGRLRLRPRAASLGFALLLGSLALRLFFAGEALGFRMDRDTIVRALSKKVITEHFELHVDPSISREALKELAEEHEFRHAQLVRFFGVAPPGRITSFVYRDVDQKAELMGARQTQIARPWAKEFHIHGFERPHRVLKHELAHVFAGEFASGLLKVPARATFLVNVGIVEGLAVAADWPRHELTVHQWTRAMRALDLAPDLTRALDPLGFWSLSSARAYTAAGSFVRWLIDTRGLERFATLYARDDFEAAYGETLPALVEAWERFIDALPLPERDLLLAEHRFKQPGIFQKVCAHVAANLAERGRTKLEAGDLEGGRADVEALMAYSPEDPGPLLMVAEVLAREERFDEAEAWVERAQSLPGATGKARARAEELLGGLFWRRGDRGRAETIYRSVLARHLSTESDRLQEARLGALSRPPELEAKLRPYLLGELEPPRALVLLGGLARAHPDDALLAYLLGRLLENLDAHAEGVTELQRATALPLGGESLETEAMLTLGRVLVGAGALEAAEATFRAVKEKSDRPAIRLEAEDWAERAAFRRARRAPSQAETPAIGPPGE